MQLWSRTAREGEHVSALSHLRSPVADWERGVHVDWFCADQTYEWIGMKKRGRRNTVERHGAGGMPVDIRHEV